LGLAFQRNTMAPRLPQAEGFNQWLQAARNNPNLNTKD
jgi:hypothetical protein